MTRSLSITYSARTDVGRERRHNEDGVAAYDFTTAIDNRMAACALFAVSDGMGGHNAGEIASMTALKSLETSVHCGFLGRMADTVWYQFPEHVYNYHFKKTRRRSQAPKSREALLQSVRQANRDVIELSRKNPAFFGMGATMTAALLVDRHLVVANVGDSRCYVMQADHLAQVTRDHTIVNQMVELGRLTEAEAASHPGRNFLYKCLGSDERAEIDVFELDLVPPAWVLLASDGLTNMVSDREIKEVLRACRQPHQATRRLIRQANQAGGKDNISVILVRLTWQ
jgi:serine/threonine protein phosphatase PrpC